MRLRLLAHGRACARQAKQIAGHAEPGASPSVIACWRRSINHGQDCEIVGVPVPFPSAFIDAAIKTSPLGIAVMKNTESIVNFIDGALQAITGVGSPSRSVSEAVGNSVARDLMEMANVEPKK